MEPRPGRNPRIVIGALALLGLGAAPAWIDPATREMAALLKARAEAIDPMDLKLIINDRRALAFAEQLEWPRLNAERLSIRFKYASELMAAGRNQEALDALDVLEEDAEKNAPPDEWATAKTRVVMQRALTHLRMAEEQNCHQGGNRDSCLLPIRRDGVHRRREGSVRAAEALLKILEAAPNDLQARWLLNVTHMTLGTYPDALPPALLIPPSTFASEFPLVPFDNVAAEVGLDLYGLSGGAILDDFDRDGLLDLMVSGIGFAHQLRLFRNRGDGSFEDRTGGAGLEGETGGLNLIQADYDNDGDVDAVVLRGGWLGDLGAFPLSLLRNNGNGTFSDVTRAAGLLRFAPTQTAVFLDYDGDGWLDLFVGNETTYGQKFPCQLFHSNRDGTFTDVARDVGVDHVGYVKGVASGDYDNDGRPDLYVSTQSTDNVLFHNDGPGPNGGGWRFTNVTTEAGVGDPRYSFGTFFFDYDNDGWLDLFAVGYSYTTAADVAADYLGLETPVDRLRLYRNRRNGTFEDVTKAMGLYKVVPGMGHNYGDLDNDGWLDVYLATGNPDFGTLVPNRMFRNGEGRVFQDVTTAGNFGHLQKGHAVCFGDIDNDGDQDVFTQMGGAYAADKAWSTLYRNPGGPNKLLGLELEGIRSNRSAIGARIEVVVETEKGRRAIHRVVGSGGSFGASPLRQEIGLGDAKRIVSVAVRWPATGQTQTFDTLTAGHRYRLREGTAALTEVALPTFRLGKLAAPQADLDPSRARSAQTR